MLDGTLAPTLAVPPDVLVDTHYDQHIRWSPGERLHHLFEERVDQLRAEGQADRLAVDTSAVQLTYEQLDARANQLARYLLAQGVRAGDRVALLCDGGVDTYVGELAVLKAHAAYVPLDAGFPPDRIAFICSDANARFVLTNSRLRSCLALTDASLICPDEAGEEIAALASSRLGAEEHGGPVEELAYIIYTSGSTGRPKGVAIEQAAICNFVRVAAEVYGILPTDRIYQGMTVAFDFSVEETWVPWMVGATLVPKPGSTALVGQELQEFLQERRITALCCVPTLLATIDEDLPQLRFLLVSGEACPQDLVARWYRPWRRFLNVYGPTEAAVTATWVPLRPHRPVTIGRPLPSYSVVILEPGTTNLAAPGEVGEICIAGICLAAGYVNRPDLTEKAFIEAPGPIPNNPSGRLYRTGDLGRVDGHGEIEYHGRIDLQVKIRGYRIELTEIESVLLEFPGVAAAVVEPYRPEPGVVDLVAYYCRRADADAIDAAELKRALRDRVPGYMVPAYYEELAELPLLPSDKVDRKRLPAPDVTRRQSGGEAHVEPTTPIERQLAAVLADLLHLDKVSATAHFFDDLGANSLVLARFCARARTLPDIPAPAMQDVYLNPTLQGLAARLEASGSELAGSPEDWTPPVSSRGALASTARYAATGIAQLGLFAGYCWLAAVVTAFGWGFLAAANTPVEMYLAAVGFTTALFGFVLVFPIVAKWLLVGREREREIEVWSLGYLRFWLMRMLLRLNPARLFAGTPMLPLYLRLLGARIGRGVLIQTNLLPACPDLLTIGPNATILRGAAIPGYRVEAGVIRTGRIRIGAGAFLGDGAAMDIHTTVGDFAQLGPASALLLGQSIPDGERWHGVPGRPTEENYARIEGMPLSAARAWVYGLGRLLIPVLVVGPLFTLGSVLLIQAFPWAEDILLGHPTLAWSDPSTYLMAAGVSLGLYLGGLTVGVLVTWTVPRLFNRMLVPGAVYPLYGVAYFCLRAVRRMTNGRFIPLFGDSNYITGYLSRLGYRLKPLRQTGTNFGMAVSHDIPYLVTIGTGTMVSDGLNLSNADFSNTSFRVRPTVVGKNVFVGNGVHYSPDAKIGDDCLLGSHVLLPISGEVRTGVGLLGSPAFEIPRSVARDREFEDLSASPIRFARTLRAKLRYNTATIGLSLLVQWLFLSASSVALIAAFDLMPQYGALSLATLYFTWPLVGLVYFIFVERAVQGFKPMIPRLCSVYDPAFWRHERFWKLGADRVFGTVTGTPFASWVYRALGAKIGRRLFDDGAAMVERSLTTIGDDVTLNAGVTLQGHSLEEGVFKSDRIMLGDRCTIAPSGFVHYGATVGVGAVVETDSFLMKGEVVPDGQRWFANPARSVRLHPDAEVTVEENLSPARRRRLFTVSGPRAEPRYAAAG